MYEIALYINVTALLLLALSVAMPMWTWHSAHTFAKVKRACRYISWFAAVLFILGVVLWVWQGMSL